MHDELTTELDCECRDLEVDPTETDIMLPPRRGQDICSRVLNYLFKW